MKTQFKSNSKHKDKKSNGGYHNKNKSAIMDNSVDGLLMKANERI